MNTNEARDAVAGALVRVVPDADVTTVDGDASLRRELEPDSLGCLVFVGHVAGLTDVRIDESHHSRLASMSSSIALLTARAGTS